MDIKKDYIRVSQLIEPWRDYEMKKKGVKIDPAVLDNKAVIGTNVHEAIQMHSLGLPIPELNEREKKYFESYLKWEEKNEPTYHSQEIRLYDDYKGLTGQLDGIFSTPGIEDRHIIDFKTTSLATPRNWSIQLGWYYLLAKENKMETSTKAFILQLKDTGSPAKLHEFEITPDLIQFCHSIYQAYIYFNPIPVSILVNI